MTAPSPMTTHREPAAAPERLVAWVDGAGAFLICLSETTTFGGLGGTAHVRLTTDLASKHAAVHRSGEGYVVEANGPAVVACDAAGHSGRRGSGRVVRGRTDLNNGDELVMYREGGSGVRLRFRRPNALTATAVLSVASEHRTDPRYDGIILLADACLLGPGQESHIRCRSWEETILLYRREGALWCKSALPLSVGGSPQTGPVQVASGDHVTAPGVSFRLEAIGG